MALCPVCNSFIDIELNCPNCGRVLVDGGKLMDFYDSYSAYLAQEIYQDGYNYIDSGHCTHLFYCPACHYDHRLTFQKIEHYE